MKNTMLLKDPLSGTKSYKKQQTYEEQNPKRTNNKGHSASGRSLLRVNYDQKSAQKNLKKSSYSGSKGNNQSHRGSITLKNKLIDFLVKAAQIQRKLQIIKQTLCEEQSFTSGSVFHRIDRDRKGYLLEKDIRMFLTENKIQFKGSELKILYGKMNVEQQDKGVLLQDFQNFILPNQNPRLRYMIMRRPVYIPLSDERLKDETEWLLSKLFLQIMKEEAKLKEINATLISSYDFHPKTVFNLLTNIQGFITGESLNNFMNNENCEISIEQVGCIIKLVDKQGQGRVCFDDLKFFLATLGLKKQHQIFDQLSPIPALKNFVVPTVQHVFGYKGTLKERVADNKLHRQSPQRRELASSGKIKRSRAN